MHNTKRQTKGFGVNRLVGRKLEIATGEAGLPAYKREAYRQQFAASGFDLPEVTHFDERPAAKSTALKWAAPSPLSTVGSLILSSLASTADNLTGKTRNLCNALNVPQRHNAAAIIDGLENAMQWESVQNVKRQRKVPVHRDTIAAIVCKAIDDGVAASIRSPPVRPADVSTLGTRLRSALETEIGFRVNCGPCSAYLVSLNKSLAPNVEAIAEKLFTFADIPLAFRRSIGSKASMLDWLKTRIERVIGNE